VLIIIKTKWNVTIMTYINSWVEKVASIRWSIQYIFNLSAPSWIVIVFKSMTMYPNRIL
jgi:hypothetical protein